MRFIHKTETASTNLDAHNAAKTGANVPLWIRADSQFAGKGRRGREWVSPKGNLYASGLFQAYVDPARTAQLSFVAALAIADTIAAYAPDANIALKWPNDVLVDGAKISGVLLETGVAKAGISAECGPYVVVGIGINLTHHPELSLYPATHLLAHMSEDDLSGPEPLYTGVEAVLAVLAARFTHWHSVHKDGGFAPIAQAWSARAYGLGGAATLNGDPVTLIGLGPNGELQVTREGGTIESIVAGDIAFPARKKR